MTTLNVYELTKKRALITRGLAMEIGDALADAWEGNVLTVDFRGIDAVTPSLVAIGAISSTVARKLRVG